MFRVLASAGGGTGFADFQVVTQRVNFNNIEAFRPAPGNTAVPGCRVTFVTSYITADPIGAFPAMAASSNPAMMTSTPLRTMR
jgi:hypothetical protein